MKTVELLDGFASTEGPLISQILVDVLGDLPLIQVRRRRVPKSYRIFLLAKNDDLKIDRTSLFRRSHFFFCPLPQADIVVLGNSEHPLITEELSGLTVEEKKLPADQSALMVIAAHVVNRKDVRKKLCAVFSK